MNSSGTDLKTYTVKVEINGRGKDKKQAISDAFVTLQKEVSSKVGDEVIIYSRPISVAISDIDVEEKTERFLFVFMPRVKKKVKITLNVTVEVQTLAV